VRTQLEVDSDMETDTNPLDREVEAAISDTVSASADVSNFRKISAVVSIEHCSGECDEWFVVPHAVSV
jgi:hypothetical protein